MTVRRPPDTTIVGALTLAVLAVSSAAVLARGATAEAPALAVAWWRVAGTALLLAPALRWPHRADLLRMALAGALLGLHFATWFAGLQHTTVLHSTVLVCLSPVWAGLAERWRAGAFPPPRFWLGVALAIAGAGLLTGDDDARASWQGDALSLLAGVWGAAYLVIGSGARARVGLGAYMGWTGLFAALGLLPALAVFGTPLSGWSGTTWGWIAGCVLLPQLVGHGALNWSLRWLPPPTVSSVLLLEPVGAALLAWAVFAETPGPLAALGAAACLAGVLTATRRPRLTPKETP